MPKIGKVIYKPERRIVTIDEYQSILGLYPYRRSIIGSNLICIECGDEITYCHGNINEPYFKHNPSRFGGKHVNCSLFTQGTGLSVVETKIRKKFVEDTDLTLNFELKMVSGKWSSFITIPPFFSNEMTNYSSMNTLLTISTERGRVGAIPLDKDHFSRGEIKQISLNGFPNEIYLNVKSSESKQGLYYQIDGFFADKQIFKTLITQNYITQTSDNINLSSIKSFNCKRVSGKIYTGRHYIIFTKEFSYYHNYAFNSLNEEDAVITQMILPKDNTFNYRIYDIVFNRVNERTEQFCESRGCTLSEESDAIIIWPPVNCIGNYKYFKSNATNLFITFENKSNALDIYMNDIHNVSGLKVKNENIEPFYLSVSTTPKQQKQLFTTKEREQLNITFLDGSSNYLFNKGILTKKIVDKNHILQKNEFVISMFNRMEIEIYTNTSAQTKVNNNDILSMIRYSEKLVQFNDKEYEMLSKKYSGNALISNYLGSCLAYKHIKENVKNYLMEDKT